MEGTELQDKEFAGYTVLEENPQPARIHFHGVRSRGALKHTSALLFDFVQWPGLLFDPRQPPFMRRHVVHYCSAVYILQISPYPVETHRDHIMQKLNLHNTAEIVLYAVRKKIIA